MNQNLPIPPSVTVQTLTNQNPLPQQSTVTLGLPLHPIQVRQLMTRITFVEQENQHMAHLVKMLSDQQAKAERDVKTMELLQEQLKNTLKKMKK